VGWHRTKHATADHCSVVTQLTIGYGDIRPIGEALFVSVLPNIESVMKHAPDVSRRLSDPSRTVRVSSNAEFV